MKVCNSFWVDLNVTYVFLLLLRAKRQTFLLIGPLVALGDTGRTNCSRSNEKETEKVSTNSLRYAPFLCQVFY